MVRAGELRGAATGRRFPRTRPDAERFRVRARLRDMGTMATRLEIVAAGLVEEDSTTEDWRRAVEATTIAWNLTVMPTEFCGEWRSDPRCTPEFEDAVQVALIRKLDLYPEDRRLISDWSLDEAHGCLVLEVTTIE